jgi:lipopolysaccharide/colanic/teichoic acid biosynthesis glycosyltransferase
MMDERSGVTEEHALPPSPARTPAAEAGIRAVPGRVGAHTFGHRPAPSRGALTVIAGDLVAVVAAMAIMGISARGALLVATLPAGLLLARAHHLRPSMRVTEQLPELLGPMAIAMLLVTPIAVGQPDADALLRLGTVAIVAVLAARVVTYSIVRAARRHGRFMERALLIGDEDFVIALVERLDGRPEYGLHVVGTAGPGWGFEDGFDEGAVASLIDVLDVDRVIVASGASDLEVLPAVKASRMAGVRVQVLPRLAEVLPAPSSVLVDKIDAYLLYTAWSGGPGRLAQATKRAIDILGALVLLVALSPVLAVAAIGVKLSSPGPVVFRQQRVGKGGRTFTMLKFRTFPVDHEDTAFSLPHEACPFPFSRFLRRSSIDELPQLLNVVRGHMSLVGPRPERPHFAGPLADTIAGYDDRHRMVGGITGLAQVHGYWGDTSLPERVLLDNRYIDSWSLLGDLAILVRTVPAILRKSRS